MCGLLAPGFTPATDPPRPRQLEDAHQHRMPVCREALVEVEIAWWGRGDNNCVLGVSS
jgi:hypothetical protein